MTKKEVLKELAIIADGLSQTRLDEAVRNIDSVNNPELGLEEKLYIEQVATAFYLRAFYDLGLMDEKTCEDKVVELAKVYFPDADDGIKNSDQPDEQSEKIIDLFRK